VALFLTTTTAASSAEKKKKELIQKAGFNIQTNVHAHRLTNTQNAREEINELTNTRAKVTRQNIYKMPLNSSLQQSAYTIGD
jgi:hypothetical protein